jgi:hypothetical protein
MWTAITSIISVIASPIKDYFVQRREEKNKEHELRIAQLQAQTEQVNNAQDNETATVKYRLESTSQSFKQNTFWLLICPTVLSVTFPSKAEIMWANFDLMPQWYQYLFISVYSSIWGLPVAKDGMNAISSWMDKRRDYKLEKARINRKNFMDYLRAKLYPKGIPQNHVQIYDAAIDAGEQ